MPFCLRPSSAPGADIGDSPASAPLPASASTRRARSRPVYASEPLGTTEGLRWVRHLFVSAGTLLALTSSPALAAGQDHLSTPLPPEGWESELLQEHPLVGTIWDLEEGTEVTWERLAQRVGEAEFVLLGETHDNPDHHRLQAWVVNVLVAEDRRPGVVFEMIRADREADLRDHLREAPGDYRGLGAAVGWEEEGWPPWSLYEPIARAALQGGLSLHPGDVERELQQAVGQEGLEVLGSQERERLHLDRELDGPLREALADELMVAHCDLVPEHAIPAMARVQRLRDASMAHGLRSAAGESPTGEAVLVAGRGHIRNDRGVPWYLREGGAGERVVTVAFVQVRDGVQDPWAYLNAGENAASPDEVEGRPPFDLVWFTPRPHDRDRCEELRERFGGGS